MLQTQKRSSTASPQATPKPYKLMSLIDRFGDTHWDFVTVEYGLGEKPEPPQMWQSTRGSERDFRCSLEVHVDTSSTVGFSFGYNQLEDERHYMSGKQALALLIDVSSEGGNLLLNVGPDEAGNIPPLQLKCLEYMADWMAINSHAIHGSILVDSSVAKPSGTTEEKGDPSWVRWTRKDHRIFAFVGGEEDAKLGVDDKAVDLSSAKLLDGTKVVIKDNTVRPKNLPTAPRPICVELRLR